MFVVRRCVNISFTIANLIGFDCWIQQINKNGNLVDDPLCMCVYRVPCCVAKNSIQYSCKLLSAYEPICNIHFTSNHNSVNKSKTNARSHWPMRFLSFPYFLIERDNWKCFFFSNITLNIFQLLLFSYVFQTSFEFNLKIPTLKNCSILWFFPQFLFFSLVVCWLIRRLMWLMMVCLPSWAPQH